MGIIFVQDFSKFLSLLKMSGVLKPDADLNSVLAGDKKHRPGTKLGTLQLYSFATTSTQLRNRASGTRKNQKLWKVSVSKSVAVTNKDIQ